MRTWNFGIIGAGLIADFHARAIGDIANARLVGCCDKITITLREDQGITVSDNGRGIPVDIHPVTIENNMVKVNTGKLVKRKLFKAEQVVHPADKSG